eukprot:6991146-Ditylum_brightwellii.AAC.1
MGPESTYKRLEYLGQCLVSNAKNMYSLALSKTREQFAVEVKLTSQREKDDIRLHMDTFKRWIQKPDILEILGYFVDDTAFTAEQRKAA